jgi:hypothetical protein
VFKVGVSTFSSNTTILLEVATVLDVNVSETIVVDVAVAVTGAEYDKRTYPSSPLALAAEVGVQGTPPSFVPAT